MTDDTPRGLAATAARVRFGALLRRVASGDAVVVERGGEPTVVALPVSDYARLAAAADPLGAWLERVDSVRGRIRDELDGRPLPPVEELIREGRDGPDDHLLADLR